MPLPVESRQEFLARITSNLNASVATIPKTPRGEDEPRYSYPPGNGTLPGIVGDGFAVPYYGGVNR